MSKKLDKILLKLSTIEKAVESLVSRGKETRSKPHRQGPAKADNRPSRGKRSSLAASSKRKASSPAEAPMASKLSKRAQPVKEKHRTVPKKRTPRVKKMPLEIVEKGSNGEPDRVISLNDISN